MRLLCDGCMAYRMTERETGRRFDIALYGLAGLAVVAAAMLAAGTAALPDVSPALRESVEAEVAALRGMPPDAVPEPATLRECLLHALAFAPEHGMLGAHDACHGRFG